MLKKKAKLIAASFLLLAIFSSMVAKAQDDKKKATIDFEDELIEGEVKKPELFYLLNKKQFNFKRLIKLRKDFIPEMERTSEELRNAGSEK